MANWSDDSLGTDSGSEACCTNSAREVVITGARASSLASTSRPCRSAVAVVIVSTWRRWRSNDRERLLDLELADHALDDSRHDRLRRVRPLPRRRGGALAPPATRPAEILARERSRRVGAQAAVQLVDELTARRAPWLARSRFFRANFSGSRCSRSKIAARRCLHCPAGALAVCATRIRRATGRTTG